MPSSVPAPTDYRGTPFDPAQRPMALAALLSAHPDTGIIQPTDCDRWFARDLNELVSRDWARPYRMRVDRLWIYRITEIGRCVAESFTDEGLEFDGFDVWTPEGELIR